jgi:hypothetical protein
MDEEEYSLMLNMGPKRIGLMGGGVGVWVVSLCFPILAWVALVLNALQMMT